MNDFYHKHITKEDKHFFPNIGHYFSDSEQKDMLAELDEFDRSMAHEKYDGLIRK